VLYERVLSNSSATGLDPFAITFWQFALGAPMLFVLWVCNANNERAAVLVYWRDRAPTAIWIATASALLALAYNMSTLWLTKVRRATLVACLCARNSHPFSRLRLYILHSLALTHAFSTGHVRTNA